MTSTISSLENCKGHLFELPLRLTFVEIASFFCHTNEAAHV